MALGLNGVDQMLQSALAMLTEGMVTNGQMVSSFSSGFSLELRLN